ncbi:hypothetical protein J9253_07520 [Thiothrix litoralis]|jgi:hypothetical protein|uniref:Uncharacterized protein n=1 Tax=Thiothrix litoralis TaxID=2891210 RepID=A0ABX7WZ39_9GAMM|nr:hypothetical protein [Thiothrix litoralis]QTR47758.1 hypothetical protein J9253_07520 [Thiothrix litoralis]
MNMQAEKVAVLFARNDSVYKQLPDVDVYDESRDARTYAGVYPVVAHPPCRAWGRLRHMAKPQPHEKALAFFAVEQVRKCGGVLEHPAGSTLWQAAGLPEPGETDQAGGFTLVVPQQWWGHKAEKMTRLYICGLRPGELPPFSMVMGEASHICGTSGRRSDGTRSDRRKEISKREREATPPAFAEWLVALARKAQSRGASHE